MITSTLNFDGQASVTGASRPCLRRRQVIAENREGGLESLSECVVLYSFIRFMDDLTQLIRLAFLPEDLSVVSRL